MFLREQNAAFLNCITSSSSWLKACLCFCLVSEFFFILNSCCFALPAEKRGCLTYVWMSWLNKNWPAVLWCGVGKWPTLLLAWLPRWSLMNMALIEFTEDKRVLIGRISMANFSQNRPFGKGGLLPNAGLSFPARGGGGLPFGDGIYSLLCSFSSGGSNKAIQALVDESPV